MVDNLLYKNIEINHCLLNTWEDKFIPFGIIDNIVYCNPDCYKQMDYTVNFYDCNYKNDNAATANISIERNYIYNSYIYSNIDNRQ